MTVSSMSVLSRTFQNVNDMGAKAVQADATMVIEGFEDMMLLCKQFPWPVATAGGVIEHWGPLGQKMGQAAQNKTMQEGPIQIYETRKNHAGEFLKQLIATGGEFNCTVYAGRPDDYTKKEDYKKCILVMDTPDRDWENDMQTFILAGTMTFHWFGSE